MEKQKIKTKRIKIPTTEKLEKTQKGVDNYRKDIVAVLTKKEQKQFKVIEKICNTLAINDIPFYLFTEQRREPVKQETVLFHWNSNNRFLTFDPKTGKLDENGRSYLRRINNDLINWIYRILIAQNFPKDSTAAQQKEILCEIIGYAVRDVIDYHNQQGEYAKK